MTTIHKIQTIDLLELQPYRTLRRPQSHIDQGIFVAEGEKVVRRLIDSNLPIVSILMTPEWYAKLKNLGTPEAVYLAEKKLLESIVGFRLHQGIMAVGRVPPERDWQEFMGRIRKPYLLIALDGILNSENVGIVMRNAGGYGVDAVFVSPSCSHPYLRRSVRNSIGAVFYLPIFSTSHFATVLQELAEKYQTQIIAADPKSDRTIYEADFTKNICLVFGNEEHGVSQEILESCTCRIAIPMTNRTDSLNVASASAVFLHEVIRQRRIKI
jgi:tRNA G18 (ribose-2'-O)-methylase SpoU